MLARDLPDRPIVAFAGLLKRVDEGWKRVLRLNAEVGTGGEAVGEEVGLTEHKSRPQRPGQRVLFDRQQPRCLRPCRSDQV
jgi:hypothetical protein